MRLEEEIKQTKPFKSEKIKLLVNSLYTGTWLSDRMVEELKAFNINDQHYNILRILRGRFPNCAKAGEIKEVLINKRGDLTRQIDKLVDMGLVERYPNPERKIEMHSVITQQGLDFLDEVDMETSKSHHLLENITEEEAKVANDILDKLRG
jgi:DNA-binding MarR family transcriptional regulator